MKPVYIIYGVSGSGKSTIGRLLAEKLHLPFYDGDDFHPEANIAKMSEGTPLNDEDRLPWLQTLSDNIAAWSSERGAVLACSALKERYREILQGERKSIFWILLSGEFNLISKRMSDRDDHFMKKEMLLSQFEILEIPSYGLKADITQSPSQIVNQILSETQKTGTSDFGVIGLGVMGSSISLNILDKGFHLSVYNRAEGNEAELIKKFREKSSEYPHINVFEDLSRFVNSLQSPRKILLMIKAGKATESVVSTLISLLDENDVIIDGGNSFYKITEEIQAQLDDYGIGYIGCGISGGEKGARFGPSIMPGGDPHDYEVVKEVLESISAKDADGNPCCTYIGTGGAGHFVKMVHNGIEYAEMQLLAEIYQLMKVRYSNADMADILERWNAGDLNNYLLGITVKILRERSGDDYLLDLILDKAGNKGTGLWSTREALEMGSVNTMMSSAVFARYISSFKSDRVKYAIDRTTPDSGFDINRLESAYHFARVINHHQGFELMRIASDEYGWDLNFSEIARIWTNGCILKSSLMETLSQIYRANRSIFDAPGTMKQLEHALPNIKKILMSAIDLNVPTHAFSSAYHYWLSITTSRSPANLIQAQRDFFGGHTFQRNDGQDHEFFHYNWGE